MNFKLYIILLLLLIPFKVLAQGDMLQVSLNNGINNYFSLGETVKLTPQGDSIIVSSSHVRVSYSKKNFWRYHFIKTSDATGIEPPTLSSSDISVSREGDDIIIKGLCAGTNLKVYHSNGTLCAPNIDYSEDQLTDRPLSATIHLGSLPQGIYIITAPNCPTFQTLKYVRY